VTRYGASFISPPSPSAADSYLIDDFVFLDKLTIFILRYNEETINPIIKWAGATPEVMRK
jgi:hypothetical protein